jgi:hypothetical protein
MASDLSELSPSATGDSYPPSDNRAAKRNREKDWKGEVSALQRASSPSPPADKRLKTSEFQIGLDSFSYSADAPFQNPGNDVHKTGCKEDKSTTVVSDDVITESVSNAKGCV